MAAPADIFTPWVNAIALALKRAMTFATDNIVLLTIAFALLIIALVVIGQFRKRPRE